MVGVSTDNVGWCLHREWVVSLAKMVAVCTENGWCLHRFVWSGNKIDGAWKEKGWFTEKSRNCMNKLKPGA